MESEAVLGNPTLAHGAVYCGTRCAAGNRLAWKNPGEQHGLSVRLMSTHQCKLNLMFAAEKGRYLVSFL
jgi:hypothetical protein